MRENQTRSWFFEKINITHKPDWSGKKDKMQITSAKNERGDIIKDHTDIKRTIREYCGQLCASKFNKLEETFWKMQITKSSLKKIQWSR